MFAGRLDQRVILYQRADAVSAAGDPTTTYERAESTAPDFAWWGRFEPTAAGEESVAGSPEMRIDGTILLDAAALHTGALTTGGVVKVLRPAEKGGDTVWQVKGVKEARAFGRVVVDVARAEGDVLALVEA